MKLFATELSLKRRLLGCGVVDSLVDKRTSAITEEIRKVNW